MTRKLKCPDCKGRGVVYVRSAGGHVINDTDGFSMSKICNKCEGKGWVNVP